MSEWKSLDQAALAEEAQHPMTSAVRLSELASLGPRAEAAVAKNPKTTPALLEKIAQKGKALAWLSLLQNPALPEACFEALYKRGDSQIRRALALCNNTPEALREKLAASTDMKILLALAKHPQTPPNVLERLSNHRYSRVYRAALKNTNNPMYIEGEPWRRFSQNPYEIERGRPLPKLLLERFARSTSYQALQIAARSPELSPEQLERIATTEMLSIRVLIARHPKITEKAARLLMKDTYIGVTNALQSNPNALLLMPSLAKKKR